ncbi:reverse transcriptase domain-containing protein [Tanacetum coccineum]
MIQEVQSSYRFHGLPADDANKHLDKFLTITQSMKQNGVTDDALRLYLFSYSLTHHATAWFDHFPKNSIHTFQEMATKFLSRYFPPSMVTKLRNDINTFYNGLTLRHHDTINAAAGGTFMKRRPEECYDLIENMIAHHNDWDTSAHRGESSSSTTSSSSEIAALAQQMIEIRKDMLQMYRSNQQVNFVTPSCETCGGPHSYYECQAVGGYTQDVYATTRNYYLGGNTYQPKGNRNLLSYRSNNFRRPPGFNPPNNQNQEMRKALQERPHGALPINTIPNPREKLKEITTQSGIALAGPSVPPPPPPSSSSSKELPFSPSRSSVIPERNPHQLLINYPSRLNKEKLQDKSDIQVHKFLQMFKKLHFNISLADALALMPKYAKMLKDLLSDKEKLLGLANTSLTKNCSMVLLKKLPEKLKDPGKFLISCDFPEFEKCMALADLGSSINLMPLYVWKKLMLHELIPTHMTLELANRSIAYPVGIAKDVCVQVGKFTFLVDFIFVDYDVNPRVPLILGRPFLRMARALVDVYGEELILRDGDEKLIFHADSTSKHPHKHGNESINTINFIKITCEDHFQEVLKIKKSNHPFSGSTTSPSDSFPSLTPFETSDSLLEEFDDELALLDPFIPGNKDDNFGPKADLREIDYLLNRDPSTDSSPMTDIDIIDPILERFTDKPALVYSFPLEDDDDYLFDLKSDNEEWKRLLYGDLFDNTHSENEKDKDLKMKCLIDDMYDDFFPLLPTSDLTLPKESSEIATLLSSSFGNEDKVFNPCILILGGTQIFNNESKDKDLKVNTSSEAFLILEERNFLSISFDQELFFHLELYVTETLLSFSSENEDKVFNPGIPISKGVHSLTLGLSHRTYETFKIINVHPNILNESSMKIFPFFCFCPKDKGIRGESS